MAAESPWEQKLRQLGISDESIEKLGQVKIDNTSILELDPYELIETLTQVKTKYPAKFDSFVASIIRRGRKKTFDSINDIIYSAPMFRQIQDNRVKSFNLSRTKNALLQGAVACPRCDSMNTFSNKKQTRGGDEAMSIFIQCMSCNKPSRLQ